MDIDKIFNTFTPVYIDDTVELQNNIYYWLTMFNKIISNHKIFGQKWVNIINEIDINIGETDLEKAGNYITYERAWFYISKINIDNKEHQNILLSLSLNKIKDNLYKTIIHFQEYEEYEKCAFIKKIIDLIE